MKWPRRTSSHPGENERLEDLFRLFSKDLRGYVQRRIRRAADVPDLTQEIFERFIRGDRQARVRSPHAYLFGVASHVVTEAKMAQQRSKVTYDSELLDQTAAGLPAHQTEPAENLALEDEMTQALDHLSETRRTALLLTKRDGLSCKEAALRMGTTEGSVRVYVCEARAQLKLLLRRPDQARR